MQQPVAQISQNQKCPKACLKTAHTLQPVTHYAINHLMLLSIEERAMSRKPLSEKELLEGITPKTAHADELATTNEKDWGSYSKARIKQKANFLFKETMFLTIPEWKKC